MRRQREILIIPFTSRPTYPTSLSTRNLIASGKDISVKIFLSTDSASNIIRDYPDLSCFLLIFLSIDRKNSEIERILIGH